MVVLPCRVVNPVTPVTHFPICRPARSVTVVLGARHDMANMNGRSIKLIGFPRRPNLGIRYGARRPKFIPQAATNAACALDMSAVTALPCASFRSIVSTAAAALRIAGPRIGSVRRTLSRSKIYGVAMNDLKTTIRVEKDKPGRFSGLRLGEINWSAAQRQEAESTQENVTTEEAIEREERRKKFG